MWGISGGGGGSVEGVLVLLFQVFFPLSFCFLLNWHLLSGCLLFVYQSLALHYYLGERFLSHASIVRFSFWQVQIERKIKHCRRFGLGLVLLLLFRSREIFRPRRCNNQNHEPENQSVPPSRSSIDSTPSISSLFIKS